MMMYNEKNIDSIIVNKLDVAFLLVAAALGAYLNWEIVDILIFVVFIGSILHPISSRYFILFALVFLFLVSFLLIIGNEQRAEEYVIYAYYFLLMTGVMKIYELRRNKWDTKLPYELGPFE